VRIALALSTATSRDEGHTWTAHLSSPLTTPSAGFFLLFSSRLLFLLIVAPIREAFPVNPAGRDG